MKIQGVNSYSYQQTAFRNNKQSFGRLVGEDVFLNHIQRRSPMPYAAVKDLTDVIEEIKKELNNPELDKLITSFSVEENLKQDDTSLAGSRVYFNVENYNVYPVKKESLNITPYLINIANDKLAYKSKEMLKDDILSFFNKFAVKYDPSIKKYEDYPVQSLADFLADYNKSYL